MEWKKLLVVMAAAMFAAYFGARFATSERGGIALAGGASSGDPKEGHVITVTAGNGQDSNRLVMVDTNKKRIMVYRVRPNYMRLIAVRPYIYDMKLEDTGNTPNNGLSYEETRKVILDSEMRETEKKSLPRGREIVVTTDGQDRDITNRIVLVNPVEKRILVYRLNGNHIGLSAMRRFDYDEQLEFTKGFAPGDGYDYQTIKRMVEDQLKRAAAAAGVR